MSSVVGASGLLASLVADSARARQTLDTLTTQAATGRIAETYAGLADAGRTSVSLRPQINQQQVLRQSIDIASGRLELTQTALKQIQSIAANLNAQLNSLNGLDPSTVDTVASSARAALQQVAGLLDTQDGGTYVFAGNDTTNPPIPEPDKIASSGFVVTITTAVSTLGAPATAASVAAATLSTASSNVAGVSPFSPALSKSAAQVNANLPTVEVGAGQRVTIGLAASANAVQQSTGGSTTGSAIRDLLRSLATVGALTSAQASGTELRALVSDTRTSLRGAIGALADEAGVLGQTQAELTTTRTRLGQVSDALTRQVSATEDVDVAATLSALSAAQTRLQLSYQLIAAQNALSLAKYLGGG